MTIYFNPPQCLQHAGAKSLEDSMQTEIQEWIEINHGSPLLLTGEPGRGKSFIAAAIYNYLTNCKGYEGNFVSLPYLYQIWMGNFDEQKKNLILLDNLCYCKCLVLDDLGIRKPSDGFLDFLYCIVDRRASSTYDFTIYTTNCNSKELTDLYSARMVSRIAFGKTIKVIGKDKRKALQSTIDTNQ